VSTLAATEIAPLSDRLRAFESLGQQRGLALADLIHLANDVGASDKDPDLQEAYRYIYRELEHRWGARLFSEGDAVLDGKHTLIKSQKGLKEIMPALRRATVVGLDTETTGLDPLRSRVRLLQIGTCEGIFVIDLFEFDAEKLGALKEWLAAPQPVKILHNAKFDTKMVLHHLGVPIGGIFDSMLASQVLSAGVAEHRHSLYEVTKRYLGVELDKTEQVSNWEGPLNQRQMEYAAKDVQVLLPLQQILAAKLAERGLARAAELEFAAVVPLSRVELQGMPYEQAVWQQMMRGLEGRRRQLDDEIQPALAGCRPQMSLLDMVSQSVNLSSEAELKRAIADMGFDVDSVSESALAPLASQHPLMPRISEVKWIDKVLVSFGEEIWRYLHPTTQRLHSDFFHLHGEAGVFRSNQPNLHAVPPTSPYRDPFRAPAGRCFAVLAWPQVELAVWAQLAGDAALGTALAGHEQPLVGMASVLVGQPAERITPAIAGQAQATAYNLAFGRGADALSRHLQLGAAAVEDRLTLFAQRFPQAAGWGTQIQQGLAETQAAATLGGRRVLVDAEAEDRVALAQRIALQASVSDLTKAALAAINSVVAGTEVVFAAATPGEVTLEGPETTVADLLPVIRQAIDQAVSQMLPLAPVHVAARSQAEWLPPA
jgi:DNA polymerase I-like protein with 3'-5' exonuclease and polymerase domains